jgi:hypothetical protein
MNDTAVAISRIKRLLDRVKPEKIQEVEDFVEFLTEKDAQATSWKKVRKMEGIWKGLGFENIDVEKELREIRRESEESIVKRSAEWNS